VNFAIVPAAGRSSRLGRDKALLALDGAVVVDRLAATLARAGIDRIVVVAAAGDRALPAHCARRGLAIACNPRPERGMLSSVLCGLAAVAGLAASDVLVVCPVDYPAIRAATVRRLLDGLAAGGELRVAVPVHEGRRGHPLALRGALAPELRALDPERGLRHLLDRHPPLAVEVADPGIHRDLDTWLDYAALRREAAPRPG